MEELDIERELIIKGIEIKIVAKLNNKISKKSNNKNNSILVNEHELNR